MNLSIFGMEVEHEGLGEVIYQRVGRVRKDKVVRRKAK